MKRFAAIAVIASFLTVGVPAAHAGFGWLKFWRPPTVLKVVNDRPYPVEIAVGTVRATLESGEVLECSLDALETVPWELENGSNQAYIVEVGYFASGGARVTEQYKKIVTIAKDRYRKVRTVRLSETLQKKKP